MNLLPIAMPPITRINAAIKKDKKKKVVIDQAHKYETEQFNGGKKKGENKNSTYVPSTTMDLQKSYKTVSKLQKSYLNSK